MTPSEATVLDKNDRMINPVTKNVWEIDDRLLIRDTWTKSPAVAGNLLAELAASPPHTRLSELAAQFIKLSEIEFTINTETPESGYVLVLANVLNVDAEPSVELLGRLEVARSLYQDNPELKVLVSGGGIAKGITEAAVMRDWLIANGVAAENIIIEDKSRDTVENMTFSIDLLLEHNARSVCLVTSAGHMERSFVLLFEYCKSKGLDINLGCRSFENPDVPHCLSNMKLERFLLFKDLGRILGIWDYQSYKIPVVPKFS